jgi:L,D-transpeptidase ErfK/SrfK
MTNPAWHVPESIRSESAGLPKVVPPGPDNPMGSHALRLSLATILIHGTNRPWGIGRRSSHGCLRLYPEDIVKLFELVPTGVRVTIVNQPIKVGARGGQVFVEAHRYDSEECSVSVAMHLLADKHLLAGTDFSKLQRAIEELKGVPVDITLSR